MAPSPGSITSCFSFLWKHLRISEMLLLWFCCVFFLSTEKNGNKDSIPRIVSICDSAVLDVTLMPSWRESRDVNQFACSWKLHTGYLDIQGFFSVSLFLHKFYSEKKSPSKKAQSYENFSFTKSAFSFVGLLYSAFILHCSLNNSLAFQSRI